MGHPARDEAGTFLHMQEYGTEISSENQIGPKGSESDFAPFLLKIAFTVQESFYIMIERLVFI